jgi:hypothetical protein
VSACSRAKGAHLWLLQAVTLGFIALSPSWAVPIACTTLGAVQDLNKIIPCLTLGSMAWLR